MAAGLYGASNGANRAMVAKRMSKVTPMTARGWRRIVFVRREMAKDEINANGLFFCYLYRSFPQSVIYYCREGLRFFRFHFVQRQNDGPVAGLPGGAGGLT